MRTGREYLASLQDGRAVVIDSQVVKDVTQHPAFAGVCQSVAGLFYAGAPFVAKNNSFLNYGYEEAEALVDRCLTGYGL
jgi:aromatic ring hydroxylase